VAAYTRPLPVVNELNRPHWDGAKNHEFLIQRCRDCGHRWFPPMPNCSNCLSTLIEWVRSPGTGSIFSYIVYHQGWLPGFKDEVPYAVAIVELDEGVRFVSNLAGVANGDIKVGMPVEVTFDDVTPEVTIPKFRPTGAP